MSRRGRRPVDYYEEDEEEEEREEIIDEPSRRRRDLDEQYVEPELESSRHRRRPAPLRREPTPPHLRREVEELIRTREKAREEPERLIRRSRGDDNDDDDDDDDVRRYEKDYLEEDVDDKRDRLPEREETEEMYIRRGSLPPRDRSRRRRVSIGDERLERRRSRDEEDVMLETQELSPPVYKDKFDQLLREDEKRTRRRRAKSREVEESEFEEREEAEIPIRRRNRSPPLRDEIIADKLRRRSLLSQDERDEEEERFLRHRDRSSRRHLVRDDREEILLRHRDASLPPRDEPERIRRRRSLPGRGEEEDDIFLRRRDHSVPTRDDREDEILIRHKERPPHADRDEIRIRHRERSGSERDNDRDEVRIRRKERLHSHRDAEDDFLEEVRVRRRHSLPPEDEEDEVIRPRRLVEDDEREEILVHRGRRDHNKKPLASGGDRDEIYIRDEPGREKVEFRHTHGPPSVKSSQSRQGSVEREDIIRLSEHKGRAGRSRLERELSRQSEAASSSESSPEEPPSVIRKPPIVQEVITHHRHIESYEKASPSLRFNVDDTKSRAGIDEVELRERGDRNGDIHEKVTIEHRHQDRSPSPSLRRQPPVEEEEEIIERSRSDDGHHSRSKEIMILEREPERDYLAEDLDRVKEKRKKRYTEVTKDLVVREAIERAGYDYDETDRDFYIYDYLRYDDVSRLVEMTEDIRQSRRERMRRERDILPPPPHLPPAPRPPMRDAYRERDVFVEGTRPRRRYREV